MRIGARAALGRTVFAVVLAAVSLVGVRASAAATVPGDVVNAVHGRVVGWAKSGSDWFVVYLDRRGSGWCGMEGASWRIALVETKRLPVHTTADRRLTGAGCGNSLSWVESGRFSDGKHREAAFMLWADPALGRPPTSTGSPAGASFSWRSSAATVSSSDMAR